MADITLDNPNVFSRTIGMFRNSMVLTAAVAAVAPVILMWIFRPDMDEAMPVWSLAAIVGGGVFGAAMNSMNRRLGERVLESYLQTMDRIVQGNLRERLTIPQVDMTADESRMLVLLGQSINRMLDRLQNVVTEITQAVQQVDADAQAILEATAKQISMANEQDQVVTETTATVNEVRATVTETAERAQSVAETAQVSVDISRAGTEAVSETISGMDLIRRKVEDIADNILVLSEHTQQIGEIIATVNNLADQSKMLALNASVEAARAGEEGKGFAVVALEVRNLADQNRDATVQVREILGEIQRATNSAVMVTEEGSKGVDTGQKLVNRAGDSIRDLSHAIEEAALAAMQIAASTRQQTIGMDQLTQAMRTIKHATAETVNGTMQVENSVLRLRKVVSRVNEMLDELKL